MGRDSAIFFWMVVLSSGLAAGTWRLVWQLSPEPVRSAAIIWLRNWTIKALVLPGALWALINIGLSWWLQPFMPQVQAAQNIGGTWFPVYLRVVGQGWFVVSSWWAAITLGWALSQIRLSLRPEEKADFKGLCIACFLGMSVVAVVMVWLGGWPLLGLALFCLLAPMAGYAPNMVLPKKLPPMYARAIAKMKFGKYTEAEWEIIHQLENAENDFEGWMMMAELYANHFHDLREAEQTVLDICSQPRITPSELSIALHRLADWQLKAGQNPDAARSALQLICDRLPGTHLARMAQLRMRQLPATAEEWREQQAARPIPLPALGDHFDDAPSDSALDQAKAVETANACVAKLRQDPNNAPAREKLARLLAEHLGQPDQGIEQLALLLDMPDQAPASRVEWMSLVAAWQLKYRRDVETGRQWLERLRREFPDTPQALAAAHRLRVLEASTWAAG